MIRKGLRASNLSKYTEFDAGDNAEKQLKPLCIIHIVELNLPPVGGFLAPPIQREVAPLQVLFILKKYYDKF